MEKVINWFIRMWNTLQLARRQRRENRAKSLLDNLASYSYTATGITDANTGRVGRVEVDDLGSTRIFDIQPGEVTRQMDMLRERMAYTEAQMRRMRNVRYADLDSDDVR